MARAGVEPKPTWQALPRSVRTAVQAAIGAPVRRAARIWGGYSPSPTFRLHLADGRRAFVKLAGPLDTEFARLAFRRELRVYDELGAVIRSWAPAVYGVFSDGDWQGLLLEDLGPATIPPWTASAARGVCRAYAEFHRATVDVALPDWVPPADRYLARWATFWDQLAEAGGLDQTAALFAAPDDARRWLDAALPALARCARALPEAAGPHALIHGDTRSDNLRLLDGRLRLFDWPHVAVAPPEFDLAAFAQSVTVDGGPTPEQIVAWYAEVASVRIEVVDAAVAAVAGYFAECAPGAPIPGLPRLRPFQRAQLGVTLAWAARRLGLPDPPPLNPVPAAAGLPALT